METYGGQPAIRCWYQLCEHFIREEQEKRGYYHDNYEVFARQCLDHFDCKHIRVGFFKIENLIDEFRKDKFKDFYPRSLKEIKRDRESRTRAEKIK